jgi:uncharacterized protein YegP (UPF0339 family)
MAAKFEIYKDNAGEYRFRLKAANGENVLKSEGYTTKAGAQNGVNSVKTNAPNANRFEKKTSTSDDPYFVLKAGNGEVIGVSEMYSSPSARDKGIEAVQRAAADADTVDLTQQS